MDLLPGVEPGFVKIIHPVTGGIAEVHQDGLGQYWRAGWVPLTEENAPVADLPPGTPAPLSEAEVADDKGQADKATPAKSSKSSTPKE